MDAEHTRPLERLWTPWRMTYIGGGAKEDGCVFCNRMAADNDTASLILHRGEHCFVIMNLFPYNTGHVMVVPNAHAADPSELDSETLEEMGRLLTPVTVALRRALSCQGFNVGLNIGQIAGAGIAAHLHQHVVPRWLGDANFMPILAATMTIPELIPVTYGKLRTELARTIHGVSQLSVCVVSTDGKTAFLDGSEFPTVAPDGEQPAHLAALEAFGAPGAQLAGWAGASMTGDDASGIAMAIAVDGTEVPAELTPTPIDAIADDGIATRVREVVGRLYAAPPLY